MAEREIRYDEKARTATLAAEDMDNMLEQLCMLGAALARVQQVERRLAAPHVHGESDYQDGFFDGTLHANVLLAKALRGDA